MYYKCKLYQTDVIFYVKEEDLDVIVDHLFSASQTLMLNAYLTEEEVNAETNNCYLELKVNR